MTPEESLLNFGTIVFSKDFMLRTINFGEPIMNGPEFMGFNRVANPSSLCLTVWLAYVPETYKSLVLNIFKNIGVEWETKLGKTVADDATVNQFVCDFLTELHRQEATGGVCV